MAHALDTSIFDVKVQDLPDPDAGTETGFGTPGNARILVVGLTFTFVADAGGANRTIDVHFTDGTNDLLHCPAPQVQTAGQTRVYSFGVGLGGPYVGATDDERIVPLPSHQYMTLNHQIHIGVVNIQATDQLSDIWMTYLRWVNPL